MWARDGPLWILGLLRALPPIVCLAAERVYPGLQFRGYAILGDDVLISDSKVAGEYKTLLSDLGV